MVDSFSGVFEGLDSPADNAVAVTPSDGVDLAVVPRGLYVGSSGSLVVHMRGTVYGQITVTNFARNYGVRTSASNQYYNSASALAGAAFGGNSSSEFRGSNGSTNADVGGNDEIRFTCVTAFGAFGGVDGEINIYGITV